MVCQHREQLLRVRILMVFRSRSYLYEFWGFGTITYHLQVSVCSWAKVIVLALLAGLGLDRGQEEGVITYRRQHRETAVCSLWLAGTLLALFSNNGGMKKPVSDKEPVLEEHPWN